MILCLVVSSMPHFYMHVSHSQYGIYPFAEAW